MCLYLLPHYKKLDLYIIIYLKYFQNSFTAHAFSGHFVIKMIFKDDHIPPCSYPGLQKSQTKPLDDLDCSFSQKRVVVFIQLQFLYDLKNWCSYINGTI